ncbi:hypothetical protein E8E12_002078 [Didymella heteroderae]|uniref:Uncharacterized protein n=1 Tax=Didymella heteroderae TaxID=1769908 RepID=A0A9P4WTN4_9PLEO|nr:hypothetical protein E8E12_002078 [Didymella heteroderae]
MSPHLDYCLKVFGFATAVTFGIWAPYSFWVSTKWNSENDAVQNALLSHVAAIATQMSFVAVPQITGVVTPRRNIEAMLKNLEALAALQYCDGKADQVAACKQFTASANLASLLSSIGSSSTQTPSLTPSIFPSTTFDVSYTPLSPSPTPTYESNSMGYPPLPAIMEKRHRSQGKTIAYVCGIVFITILY